MVYASDLFGRHIPPTTQQYSQLTCTYQSMVSVARCKGVLIYPYLQITLSTHALLLKAALIHTHKTARAYIDNPQKMHMHAHNSVHTYQLLLTLPINDPDMTQTLRATKYPR